PTPPPLQPIRVPVVSMVVCILSAVVLAFAPIIVAMVVSNFEPDAVSASAGAGVGVMILIAVLVAPVAFLLRRRAPNVAPLTFSVVALLAAALLCVIPLVRSVKPGVDNRMAAVQRLDALNRETASKEASGSIEANDVRALVHNVDHELKTIAADTKGDEKLFLLAMADFNKIAGPANVAYVEAIGQFTKAGGSEPDTLTSRDHIAQRIGLLDRAIKAAEAMHEIQAGARAFVIKHMTDAGAKRVEVYLNNIRFTRMRELETEFAASEVSLCKALRPFLIELHDSFSHWTREGRMVYFTGSAPLGTVDRFNDALKAIDAATAENARINAERKAFREARKK
ncbi:MAG: hypothetical protein K2X32_11855, partial [Phycisphaerales bacterium]|nr:hypothetical protein [Phycisphaerales bacterium]